MKKTKNYSVVAADAIAHLEEKYDREFTLHGYELSDYLSTTDRVFCETEGLNPEADEHVIVGVLVKDDGKIEFVDNYFGYIVRPQIEEYVQEMVQSEFSDVKVYGDPGSECLSNDLTKDSTLEDLYEVKNDYKMNLNIYIKGEKDMSEEEYEEKIKRIEEKMIESKRSFMVSFYVIAAEVYDSIDRYEQEEFIKFAVKSWEPDGEKWYFHHETYIYKGEVR